MSIHREVPRTAAFAWSPGSSTPLIATGTRAGAVDADFSSDTQLELWDLDLGGKSSDKELQPIAQVSTDSRFHDVAWVQPKEGHARGIIAGGLENGSLDLWDAAKLIDKQKDVLMSRTTKHTGAIKALQFNPFRTELLATAGAKGELYISDLNNIANPFRLGTNAGRADDFECLDWNKQVPHILVTGSSGGFVTVWDVKSKKESLNLNNNGRKAVSAVAWDPEKSTRLITAVPLDSDPLILVWDLRNSNAPEKVMRGHEGGVLGLSWCRDDNDIMLSCGKDNRTICWNPQSGEAYGDFPVVTNWTFQTKWNPHNPSIFATASFDGKIAVRTIQNTKNSEPGQNAANQGLEGADFFDKASSQPQTSSFSLPKAPKWLECPVGASFGFGGKLISISQTSTDGKPTRKSVVRISNFTVDNEISGVTESFANSVKEGDLKGICATHITNAKQESEKDDWKVIETLLEPNPRKALVRHLGLTDTEEEAAEVEGEDGEDAKKADANDDATFFDEQADNDDILPRLASTKGIKTSTPFQIHSDGDTDADKNITRALMQGQFVKAMEVCLKEDRLSDALMIAMCGGDAAQEKVKKAYFRKQASGPSYIRLLASIIGKNLWDVVHNADLSNWKEVMASLCTYAAPGEFSDLCEALGDRLEEQSRESSEDDELRQSASFCYIAGSNLEKVVGLWIADMQRNEETSLKSATSGSSFSIHAAALQAFIEKVTVFREATHYEDTDAESGEDSKLTPLYQRYIEYADIVSAHGQLTVAEQYLRLLPKSYQTAQTARDRVQQATKPAQPVAAQRAASAQPAQGYMPPMPTQPNMQPLKSPPSQYPQNSYAAPQPPGQHQYSRATPYGGPPSYQSQQPPNPYGPPQHQQPQQPPSLGPPPSIHGQGPPRGMSGSPSVAPPSQARDMGNWNDLPEGFGKAPTPRRGTPTVPPNNAQIAPNPYAPSTPSYGAAPPKPAQPPPPPKGMAPPPRTAGTPSQALPERPPSTSNYAPSPTLQGPPIASQTMGQPPRGSSPYNPPPQSGPLAGPNSRYAPSPAPAPTQQGPPTMRSPPPNPYAAPPGTSGPPSGPPPQGGPPPQVGPPPVGGPPRQGSAASAPPPSAPPPAQAANKHPSGDRTHIPPFAAPIYELLSADMARVKGKAPASFKTHVVDTEKRLNILFDHLNNQTLLTLPTVHEMVDLAQAIAAKEYDRAMQVHLEIVKQRNEECTNWMTGVKRLISMSRATP